ncbi:MAG TPA: hypothetical protein PKV94_07765 [Syntrophales bacterium]|nr:hypothetical protein [Syntrophales bacterium]HPN24886.1 hypothetical protein [Syntrophales bacterium]
MTIIIIFIVLVSLTCCQTGQKVVGQEAVKEFFAKNRVGSSPDYAVMKNGEHLITIHGYADDRDVCLRLIEPYNRDPSQSVIHGTYTCVPLNK